MSNYYYGCNKGDHLDAVVVGTSTNSTDIELFVTGANVTDRQSLINALDYIRDFVEQKGYPPA